MEPNIKKGEDSMADRSTDAPLLPYLVACVTFFYRPERLPYLATVISNYIGLASRTDIHVVTNIADTNSISETLPHLPDGMSVKFVTPQGIGHPFLLTWAHRDILQIVVRSRDVTHFLYSEDDVAFTRLNVMYWLRFRDPLRAHGLIPSFFRVELHPEMGWCSSDCIYPMRLRSQPRLALDDGSILSCVQNPYQGMYFLDRELMEEFVASPAMSPDFGMWPIREKAAQGLTFVNVPKGYTSRNVVLIDPLTKTVAQEAWMHHLPNNLANSRATIWGKLPMQGNGLFVTGVLPFRRGWKERNKVRVGQFVLKFTKLTPENWSR